MKTMKRNPVLFPLIVGIFLLNQACAKKADEGTGIDYSRIDGQLQKVEETFVPDSIQDDGGALAQGQTLSKVQRADDICGDDDFLKCQPKLLRAYVKFGREFLRLTRKVVREMAKNLEKLPNNSNGEVRVPDQDLLVMYNKVSPGEFSLLVKKGATPIAYVSVKSNTYRIEFDTNAAPPADPNSRHGKFDIAVNFSAEQSWTTDVRVTNMRCDLDDPKAPEAVRLVINRDHGLWKGAALMYSGNAGNFGTVTCSTPSSDQTGLAIYTDFVGDSKATKAALYVMKRTKSSASDIQSFGLNQLCSHYSDICQAMGEAAGLPAATAGSQIASALAPLSNPYCVKKGSQDIQWNNNCQSLSTTVSGQALHADTFWEAPIDFYQKSVQLPFSL